MSAKKDPKIRAFEQELLDLMVKYGFLPPTVDVISLNVSISETTTPIISMVTISH